MGTEYIIKFDLDDSYRAERILENAPCFSGRTEHQGQSFYEFRRPDSIGGMPDATATIEPGGIYFCSYGQSEEILRAILGRVEAELGEATLEDYEEYLESRRAGDP